MESEGDPPPPPPPIWPIQYRSSGLPHYARLECLCCSTDIRGVRRGGEDAIDGCAEGVVL